MCGLEEGSGETETEGMLGPDRMVFARRGREAVGGVGPWSGCVWRGESAPIGVQAGRAVRVSLEEVGTCIRPTRSTPHSDSCSSGRMAISRGVMA